MPSAIGTTTIARPPDEVFAFVADGTTAPRWRPGVLDIALVSGSGVGARYRQGVKGPGGRRVAADYEITGWEPGHRLAFAATAGPVRPRGEYVLEAVPEGTKITFSLTAELGGIKALLMGRAVQSSMDAEVGALAGLKRVLEAG
ncbi:MAG TPA: SRPBCC family protein [Candidatus Limnocylindrales bacterium]